MTVSVPEAGAQSRLIISRHFTSPEVHPFDTLPWKRVDAVIVGANGVEKFRQDNVEVPEYWSDTTTGIVAEKYFRVVDGKKETSARQMFDRVAGWIANKADENGYLSADEAVIFYEELLYMLVHGMYAFNSPVWFNVGVVDEPQCSACFIQSVDDTMEDIMDLAKREVMLFKGGSGTGGNLSKLRSSYEQLSKGGYASGPVSFMLGYDSFAGVTKSGGTTRRAAKMQVLNVDHPDILEQRNGLPGFIGCKSRSEQIAHDLYNTGEYTAEWNIPGNVYDLVPYQNANNSVRVTDGFMASVRDDKTWTTYLKDGTPHKTYESRHIWKEIAKAAHVCGDPGLQFDTITNMMHTCPSSGRINASNPCSEYLFLDETACNLGSLNLMKFSKSSDTFDVAGFIQAIQIAITAKEFLVGLSSYPSEKITEMSHKFRTLGLGFTNLGALLTYWGLPYDSDEGRAAAASISAIMGGYAYLQSALLAARLGPFEAYKDNELSMLRVISTHLECVKSLSIPKLEESDRDYKLRTTAVKGWEQAKSLGEKHGFRNAQVTVIAPTGTISFLMGCDTTGIEPMLGCVVYKKVVGEGLLILPNKIVSKSLANLGYSEEEITSIEAHLSGGNSIHTSKYLKEEHRSIFAEALGDHAIPPEAHVDMMAAVQPFISGGISKTVNMPSDATPEDIENIYMRAWDKGLKCIAIFRDGCKLSQPVNTKLTDKSGKNVRLWGDRKPVPSVRSGDTHKFSIAGLKGYITANSFDDGSPAELFLRVSKQGSFVNGILEALATAVSIGLQHGVPLELFVDKFKDQRFEPSGFTGNPEISIAKSLPDYVFRWLNSRYNKQEDTDENEQMEMLKPVPSDMSKAHGPPCSSCGNLTVRSGSCYLCPACGDTTGCG